MITLYSNMGELVMKLVTQGGWIEDEFSSFWY